MGGTVLVAALSLAAVIYPFGRLARAYRAESRREKQLELRRAVLDTHYAALAEDSDRRRGIRNEKHGDNAIEQQQHRSYFPDVA